MLKEAIDKAGYSGKVFIGIDAAASEFFKNSKYDLDFKSKNPEPSKKLAGSELCNLYKEYFAKYPGESFLTFD